MFNQGYKWNKNLNYLLSGCFIVALFFSLTTLATATPFSTTRYVKMDTLNNTGYIYDEEFIRLPDDPQIPGTSAEYLPENKSRWFLGTDVDIVRRNYDLTIDILSQDPAYSTINHHFIWRYVTDSRPVKDPCGILPIAASRELTDIRLPGGYGYKMQGGALGGVDWHWTNGANVALDQEDIYIRFILHWDDEPSNYRDTHVTWIGVNACQEEFEIPPGKSKIEGPSYTQSEHQRIVAVVPHMKDHAKYIELRKNGKKIHRFKPTYNNVPSAHYGDMGNLSIPLHSHKKHITNGGLPMWLPGIHGPKIESDDNLTVYGVYNNIHDGPIENSAILFTFWEEISESELEDETSNDHDD